MKKISTLLTILMLAVASFSQASDIHYTAIQDSTHMTKSGKLDKRYNANKHVTKSGKMDMRYKSSKKAAAKMKKDSTKH